MGRIESLTPEQTARFPEFIDKWTRIGLSTDPADRPRAERAINDAYRIAGLNPPERIVWCGSPLSQGITRAIILDKLVRDSVGDSVGASVRGSVWDSVRASVRASVRGSVGDSVGASVRASVGNSVRASVWDSVRASVWASVRASVGDSVRASVGDSVRGSVWDSVRASVGASLRGSVWASGYGQHDADWIGFYDYFRCVLGLTAQTEKLLALTELTQSAGWYLPHKNICWVSERHCLLHRDAEGRLHNLSGPACMYPDGWAIYAVHGVRVPAWIIEHPEKITVPVIDAEKNQEVRRVMVDRFGYERFICEGSAELVKADEWGKLWSRKIGDDVLMMCEVVNSTHEPDGSFKTYFLRVHPELRPLPPAKWPLARQQEFLAQQTAQELTPRNAIASTFGKRGSQYAPSAQS